MKNCLIILLLAVSLFSLVAQEVVRGEIIYIEGDVNVSRRGEFLPGYEVDMGLFIESEDMVRTGMDGYLEIELTYPRQGSIIKIQPDTAFYFESMESTGKSAARVNLLNGTIGLKVSKLTSNQSMNVETQSAVMGIRGTEFHVNASPTGELLVTCREGKVSCATAAMETFSEPGQVCEQTDGKDFSTASVAVSDLDDYRENWWAARMEALVSIGPLAAEYYSGRYGRQVVLFDDAWNALEGKESLFREYEQILDRGESPAMSKAARDKISLSTPVIKMRSALPLMEEIYYTMLILEEYHQRGFYSANSRYFKDFNRRKEDLEEEIVLARYYMKLYGEISRFASGGTGPSLLDDMMNSNTF